MILFHYHENNNQPPIVIPAQAGIQAKNAGFQIESGLTTAAQAFILRGAGVIGMIESKVTKYPKNLGSGSSGQLKDRSLY